MTPLIFVGLPRLLVTETKFTLVGSVSVKKTSEAVLGPRLVTLIVKVMLLPRPVFATEAAAPTLMSAKLFPPQQVGGAKVVSVSRQPPATLPASPAESSYTYKFQIPVGSVPLKTDRLVPYGLAGAGAGRSVPGG